jgi:hypothetical protein
MLDEIEPAQIRARCPHKALLRGYGSVLAPTQVFQVTNHSQGQEDGAGFRGKPKLAGRVGKGVPTTAVHRLEGAMSRALASFQGTEACGLASKCRNRYSGSSQLRRGVVNSPVERAKLEPVLGRQVRKISIRLALFQLGQRAITERIVRLIAEFKSIRLKPRRALGLSRKRTTAGCCDGYYCGIRDVQTAQTVLLGGVPHRIAVARRLCFQCLLVEEFGPDLRSPNS